MKSWMSRKSALAAFACATLALAGVSPARAGLIITGDTANSESGLGDFSGSITYSAADASNATLVVILTNTSPLANGGFLTAFVLNNPGDLITGIGLTSTSATFDTLLFSNDNVNGSPFGQFDFGATTQGSFNGGGPPSNGLGVGASATFTFALTGSSLDTLDESSFQNTLSVPPGAGQGVQFFAARFRGFEDGGSDKVPAMVTAIPEPASIVMLAVAGVPAGLVVLRRRRRAAR